MLRFVVRRAWVQRRLLSGVVLLMVVATTLLGFCSLLLSVTGPKALSEQVQRAQPREVDVTAYVTGLPPTALEAARQDARDVVGNAFSLLHPSVVSTATSRIRLFGTDGLGYLATSDALNGQVTLTSGRWPGDAATGPVEALAPASAARRLHLRLGERVTLGAETGVDGTDRPVTIVVTGTFRPTSQPAWASDPLSGAGFSPSYSDASVTAPTYGPFLVGGAAFLSTGSDVAGLRVDGQPDLSTADDTSLQQTVAALDSASGLLSDRVGASASNTRVASELPVTLRRLHAQQAATRSAVLVVLLLGMTLALAALLLASGLVADTRADERELLTVWGLSRAQQLTSAVAEALLLALTAAALAVPAAAVVHAVVTHLPGLETAGLDQAPTVTPGLVMIALAGAVLLALVFVLSPMVASESSRLPGRRGAVARSGIDVLLLVVAGVGWWQLHSRSATASGSDVLLLVSPVLCLAATTMVAVRTLPALLALAAAAGSRSRALVPLALHSAALRLRTGTALALLSAACAAAVFGVAMHATWERSQNDQADLQVGTGLSLALASPLGAEGAAGIAHAALPTTRGSGGLVVSPVTARPVALGNYLGHPGQPPELVALETRHAGALLRGRLEGGSSWSEIGRQLTPDASVPGVPLPPHGRGVTVLGRAPAGVALTVTPVLVLEDATGFRSTLDAAPVPADGRRHQLRWSTASTAGQRVVAVDLTLADNGSGAAGDRAMATVSVDLRIPGRGAVAAGWQARPAGPDNAVDAQAISVRQTDGATVLTTRAHLNLSYLLYIDGEVLATDFDPPATVPVAVSRELADAVGVNPGGTISATVGRSTLAFRVVEIVSSIPSAPGRIAVLADGDTLSRALIGHGYLEPVVDSFWVSGSSTRTTQALSALNLGEVTSRAAVASDLTGGPMQVTVPVAYVTLGVMAVLLLLAGAALVVSADQRTRTAEVARLRALGLTRGGARGLLLAEHAALLVPLALTGMLVGGAVAAALSGSLVRSVEGTAPLPSAVLAWPWRTELLLGGGIVLGCLVIAAIAAASQVRRSDMTRLRAGGWR